MPGTLKELALIFANQMWIPEAHIGDERQTSFMGLKRAGSIR
jgi:hypothetical protein